MIVAIILLGYFFVLKNKITVSGVLILFISSTVLLSYLIERNPRFIDFKDYLNMGYTVLLLFLIISAFKGYHSLQTIGDFSNENKINIVSKIVIFLGIVALVCNAYIVYNSISLIFLDSVDVQTYKNEGGAEEMIKTWVPRSLLTFTHLISPLSYVAFGLHFYFFTKGKYKLSVLLFLISLNMPLHGLHGLSRSAPSQFIMMYFFSVIYVMPALSKELRKKIIIIGGTFIIGLIFILFTITTLRFEESSYYDSRIPKSSMIQNKTLFSVVDYLTQWNYQNIETLRNYSIDKVWYGKASTPAFSMFFKKFLDNSESYVDVRRKTLGKDSSAFNGLISTLVYDFGYMTALILTFFFYYLVKKNSPRNGYVSIENFLTFSLFISIPALSFGNNVMSSLIFNIAIIYVILIKIFFKIKFPKFLLRNSQNQLVNN